MELDPTNFASKLATESQAAPAPLRLVDSTTVVVKSTPSGAEITVDGNFVGSTPSTLTPALGDHRFSVEKPAFKKWQRTMTVNAGSNVRLDATLVEMTTQSDRTVQVAEIREGMTIAEVEAVLGSPNLKID